MNCIDLQTDFFRDFKISHDPAYAAEHGPRGFTRDPWLLTIPCQHGEIYPHGGDRLGFASRNRGPIARQVAQLPGARIEQEGDDGFNVSFPVSMFPEVAKLVGAKRKRRLSPEQREAAAERLRKYQFPPARNTPETAQDCVRTPQADSEAAP